MTHHPGQGLQADAALSDALVPVLPGAGWVLAVVEVDSLQPVQADDLVKLCQHAVQIADDVVSAVGDMAGIQTDAHVILELHPVQNLPQFLEAAAHLTALSCHGLQQNGGGLVRGENGVQALGNKGDAGLHPLPHMAAGVEVVVLTGHMLHAPQVVGHGLPGKGAVLLLRAAEVQGIGCVGDDGGEAVFRHQGHQGFGIRRVQVLGLAPPGISGEKLKGIRPQLQRLPPHGGKALGGGQVTADVQHKAPPDRVLL